jgi:hypothetical protein
MTRRFSRIFILPFAIACLGAIAFADQIPVGLLSYDAVSASQDQFDITDLTGVAAFPPSFPITTKLNISVTDLVVNFTSGPALTLPGSDFTVVDTAGDLNCTGAGCNLFGDSITSAILTGTFSPTTGLSGLPAGDTGILAAFTTTLTPSSGPILVAGTDLTIIDATGVSTTPTPTVPEPSAWLLCLTVIGLALACARLRSRSSAKA